MRCAFSIFVETIGRRPGGVRDQPLHRASRLAEVLLSLLGRRVPDAMRTAVIKYACETEGDDAGVAIEPERVRDLLNRPRPAANTNLPRVRGGEHSRHAD